MSQIWLLLHAADPIGAGVSAIDAYAELIHRHALGNVFGVIAFVAHVLFAFVQPVVVQVRRPVHLQPSQLNSFPDRPIVPAPAPQVIGKSVALYVGRFRKRAKGPQRQRVAMQVQKAFRHLLQLVRQLGHGQLVVRVTMDEKSVGIGLPRLVKNGVEQPAAIEFLVVILFAHPDSVGVARVFSHQRTDVLHQRSQLVLAKLLRRPGAVGD